MAERCDLCPEEAEWFLTPDEGPNLCGKHFQLALIELRLWILRGQMKNMARNGKVREVVSA